MTVTDAANEQRSNSKSRIAVVVCVHTFDRLPQTVLCLESLFTGVRQPDEIVVVVDQNPALQKALEARLTAQQIDVVANTGSGLSAARNTGLRHAKSSLVAFIDDDAWADRNWLREIEACFDDESVIGVGGRIVPDWERPERTLPPELFWIVGATYKGHREDRGPIPRPIGASMAGRREVMLSLGGFSTEFGPKAGAKSSSNDELSLFGAIARDFGQGHVWYVPTAAVYHFAPEQRCAMRYVVSRSLVEGSSKAEVRALYGNKVMGHDRSYVQKTLLPGIGQRLVRAAVDRDATKAREAGVLVVSLVVTGTSYSVRRFRHLLRASLNRAPEGQQ